MSEDEKVQVVLQIQRRGFGKQMSDFIKNFALMQKEVHENAVNHGWWERPSEDGTLIALMHSELSEALEALRQGNPPDKHCPEYDAVTVELADCVIRIMDYAEYKGIKLAEAIIAKHAHNRTRPYKHGGKKF